MMTLTISGNPYSSQYQWRTQSQSKAPDEELANLLPPEPVYADSYNYDYDAPAPSIYDGGSASLAAALWEMETAKAARLNQNVGTVEPTQNEEPQSYGLGLMPMEVVRNQVLQRLGLTEGDVADMLPTERRSIEAKIDDQVEQLRMTDLLLAR